MRESVLYKPKKIGSVEIKNRMVMGPAGYGFCDESNGYINDRMIEFMRQRARGGVGLIDLGAVQIDPDNYTDTDMIKLLSDDCIPGMRRLTDAVHEEGGIIMAQLLHQGRYSPSKLYHGKLGVAPSAVPSNYTKETPRELSTEECEAMIGHYHRAAQRAVEAGFDLIEIGTNSGYLIGQFLSPLTNLRTDRFGGETLEQRMTFLLEVVKAVREGAGKDVPISVRLGGNDFMHGSNTNTEVRQIAVALENAGVDAIHITGGWHETFLPQVTMDVPHGVYSYLGKQVKEVVSIPVIQSNRMDVPTAERLLDEGVVDFVAMARPLIADPNIMNKAKAGKYSEIRPCVGCNQGCLDMIMAHNMITCLVNAEVGRECELLHDGKLPTEVKSQTPEKMLIIGAGPAGMEFARVSANRGHKVTIWERKDHAGGQFEVNSAPPGRHDFATFGKYLANECERLGVEIILNKDADADEISAAVDNGTFDRVVVAAGAQPIAPKIPAEDGANVVQAWDVLLKKVHVGKNIVIVGGGAVGVETGEMLAEMGTLTPEALKFLMLHQAETPEELYKQMTHGTKNVTIVEMQKRIGNDIGVTTRWGMLARLKKYGVTTLASSKVVSIRKTGVVIEKADGEQLEIPADTVVLAIGSLSNNTIYTKLQGKVEKLNLVGDAIKPAFIIDAVRSAYDAACAI